MTSDLTFKGFETRALHAGQQADPATGARAVPIYASASFGYQTFDRALRLANFEEAGFSYSRNANPTNQVLEQRIAALEGGSSALALASGQAALTFGLLTLAHEGDNIVASTDLYGNTFTLLQHELPRLGITTRFVDSSDFEGFHSAIDAQTKAVIFELIGNPRLNLLDLEQIATIAHAQGVPVLVDNTVATPYLNRPFEWGADIIVHSATKYIGGHGTVIGGLLVDSGKFDWRNGRFPEFTQPTASHHGLIYAEKFEQTAFIAKARIQLMRNLGATLSPFNAFLILQGLETLGLRMERHSQNALGIARYLKEHSKVRWVSYPGLPDHPNYALAQKYLPKGQSGLVSFGLTTGYAGVAKFIDKLKLFTHLANIGDAKSLAVHPATTTHGQLTAAELAQAGVSEDLIRLSVGIETLADLLTDLEQALAKV